MKCPKCGFISFDNLDNCKRCNADLDGVRTLVGLAGLQAAQAGVLLESSSPGFLKETGPEFMFSESGEAEEAGFQFEETQDRELSPVADAEDADLGQEPIFDLKEEDEDIQEIQLNVSELEEELSFEPDLGLGSTDDSLGDMEFELDIPLDEAPAAAEAGLKTPGKVPEPSLFGEAEEDESLFDLSFDVDEEPESTGAEKEISEASVIDEGPDLDLSELELDGGLDSTAFMESREAETPSAVASGEDREPEFDLSDLELPRDESFSAVEDVGQGGENVREEADVFALDEDEITPEQVAAGGGNVRNPVLDEEPDLDLDLSDIDLEVGSDLDVATGGETGSTAEDMWQGEEIVHEEADVFVLDEDEITPEPVAAGGGNVRTPVLDEELDLTDLELEVDSDLDMAAVGEPAVEAQPETVGEAIEDLDPGIDFQEQVQEVFSIPEDAGELAAGEEDSDVFALDLDEAQPLELEMEGLSADVPAREETTGGGEAPEEPVRSATVQDDLGDETLEDLTLEDLGKDEIFRKPAGADEPGGGRTNEGGEPAVFDLDTSEDDFEALARDFENGIEELEKEERKKAAGDKNEDDDLFDSIPDLDFEEK